MWIIPCMYWIIPPNIYTQSSRKVRRNLRLIQQDNGLSTYTHIYIYIYIYTHCDIVGPTCPLWTSMRPILHGLP